MINFTFEKVMIGLRFLKIIKLIENIKENL